MSIKKWLLGVLVFVSLLLCVKVNAKADAAFGVDFWNEYEAIVINPDGVDCGREHLPYGTHVWVWDEYERSGNVYVYISEGDDYFDGAYGYVLATGNIQPVEKLLSEYSKADYTVITYTETKVYSLPSLNAPIIQTIPAGKELQVIYDSINSYSSRAFGYVGNNEYSGWIVIRGYGEAAHSEEASARDGSLSPSVLIQQDTYRIIDRNINVIDDSFNETGEIIHGGTRVHVIGEAEYAVGVDELKIYLVEVDGKKAMLTGRDIAPNDTRKYELYITSPKRVQASLGFEDWENVDVILNYDDKLPNITNLGKGICLYGDNLRILYTDFELSNYWGFSKKDNPTYNGYDNDPDLWEYFFEGGCFLVGAANEKKTIKVYENVECYDDWGSLEKRSTLEKGKKAEAYFFDDGEAGWVTAYVVGYGWADVDELLDATVKKDEEEEPAVEEPKEEPKDEEPKPDPTKVVLGEGESKTDERRILIKEFDIFAERELINKIGTIESGKGVTVRFIYPDNKEKTEENYIAANIEDYGWVNLEEFLANSYEDTKKPKTLGEFSTTQTRILDADITCYVDWTLRSLNLNSNSIKAGQEVTVTFRYSEGSADDERNFTNAVINGYLWVNVKELLAKSHVSIAKTEEEPKVEEPKVAEPESVTSPVVETPEPVVEPVTPQKQLNPISRTLIICLAFAVVIAGAAVLGIGKLSKKKKEDK